MKQILFSECIPNFLLYECFAMHMMTCQVLVLGPNTRGVTYRPICCLLNVSFKAFTKVATNRIVLVAQKVIRPSQTAFMLGRNIMNGAIILHETILELQRKR